MNEVPDHSKLERFYNEGRSWGEDRLAASDRSRRIAWWIAGVAAAAAICQAVALVMLLPLKTVIPYTVLVDRQTGYVTTVDPTKTVEIAPDSALTRSMLAQYVSAREEVDRATIRTAYRKAVLWSQGAARSGYIASMSPNSPQNPLQQIPPGSRIGIQVRSVAQLDPGLALVRFDRFIEGASGSSAASPYVATLRFAYRKRPLSESDRFINPLGFEVTSYRRDAETPSASIAAQSVGPGSVAARLPPTVSRP